MSTEQTQTTADELARKEAQRIEEQAKKQQVQESTQSSSEQLLVG